MAALPELITVAQFRQMPENESYLYELHYGEVVAVTRPKYWHIYRQNRIKSLLEHKLPAFEVMAELSFRVVPEFDIRAADVGAIPKGRHEGVAHGDDLFGAPELVIEIKSPSNTVKELKERASLCLTHGSLEFWIVDEEHRTIAVYHRDGSRAVYRTGESIPLTVFGSDSLAVDEIFA
jgi:Uma2 family endonuclease